MQRFKLLPNFDFFQKIGGSLVLRTVQNTGNGREEGVTNVEYSSRSRCELVQTLIFLNLKLFFRTEFYSA